jgi:hypothetical protein
MKQTVAMLMCAGCFGLGAAEPSALTLVSTVPLPGVKGRFDHFSFDARGHKLFVAALGNNTLEIVDTAEGKRLKSIPGLHKPTGVLFLPERNQIAVANGDDGTLKLFNGTSCKLEKSLGSLDDADNLRLDEKAAVIYVGYGEGALAMIDAGTGMRIGSIKLAAHPESFQLEQQGARIFVNVPDAKQVAVIDREKRAVIATWPMGTFRGNFPMALDEANHRLFVGCRQPPRLVVLDIASGQPVTDVQVSGDADDLFYDASRKRIYVSCGEGFLDVLQASNRDRYARIQHLPTRAGARTCFYSPDLDKLYLAVPQREGHDAEIRVYATGDK